MSAIDPATLPEPVKQAAAALGIDPVEFVTRLSGGAAPSADEAAAAAAAAAHPAAGSAEVPGAVLGEGVKTAEPETPEQKLERENAGLRQEIQQVRDMAQRVTEGRVVGSGGGAGPVEPTLPTLATVEPGIRFLVRNGLVEADSLVDKLGPVIVDLLKKDLGGII